MDIGNLVYSFFNSQGPGGVFVLLVYGLAVIIYYVLTRWILAGDPERDQ